MTDTENTAIVKLRNVIDAMDAAEMEADNLLPDAYPLGTMVTWPHGIWWREATVVDHSCGLGLCVRGNGDEYWIDARRVNGLRRGFERRRKLIRT